MSPLVIDILARVLPHVAALAVNLIEHGLSGDDAAEVIARDIRSLAGIYDSEKAADEAALAAKHAAKA